MTVEISKGDLFHKGFESSNKSPSSKHIKTKPDSSDRKHYPEVTVIFSGGGMTVFIMLENQSARENKA